MLVVVTFDEDEDFEVEEVVVRPNVELVTLEEEDEDDFLVDDELVFDDDGGGAEV